MDRETFREIMGMLKPLKNRLMLVASRAVVELTTDTKTMQGSQVSLLPGEVMEPEHMQPGGLTHVPLPGSEGVYLTVGGVRDDGVLICVSDRRYRPKGLAAGETALYNDAPAITQSKILLKADGSIEVMPAAGKGVLVGGSTAAQAQVLGNVLTAWLSAHTHPTAMGPSGPPVESPTVQAALSAVHKIDQ